MHTKDNLTNRQKFNYGLGEFSSNIMFAAVSFYFLYFMINVGGLSPYLASIIFLITKFTDGITDYLMGLICDHTLARKGNRRMFMLWGALPFGLFFSLLWIVPDTSIQIYKFVYFLTIYSLYDTIWTVVFIPYNSLLANITSDYDERTSLNGWRVLIANFGMIIGAALFPLLADGQESIFYAIFGSEKSAYFFASLLFGIIGGVLMMVCALRIKEQPSPANMHRATPFKTLKQFFSMKEFRNTLLYYMFAMAGADIIMGTFVFYISDALAITSNIAITSFLFIILTTASCSAIFWVRLSERYSKHSIYAVAIVGVSLSLISSLWIAEKAYLAMSLFCVVAGFFTSAVQVLPFASIPDVVEADEYYHGVRREGSYFGIVQFTYNMASGIAMSIVSVVLGACGYVEAAALSSSAHFVQHESALWAIRITFALFPTILFVASVYFAHRADMGRGRFNEMKQSIIERKKAMSNKE